MHAVVKVAQVALVACVVLTVAVAPRQPVLASSLQLLETKVSLNCPGKCQVCAVGGHVAFLTGDSNNFAAEGDRWHGDCEGSSNCTGHICLAEAEEQDADQSAIDLLDDLRLAVLHSDGEVLHALIAKHPATFKFVAARQAVQATNCDGGIIAHYPLDRTTAAQLE